MSRNPDLHYTEGSQKLVSARETCIQQTADVKVEFETYVRELVDVPTVQEIKGGNTVTIARLDFNTLRQAIETLNPDDKEQLLGRVLNAEKKVAPAKEGDDAAGARHPQRPRPARRQVRRSSPALLHPVVGRLFGDDHVVHVALPEPGRGDAHEAAPCARSSSMVRAARVAHAAAQAADQLVDVHGQASPCRARGLRCPRARASRRPRPPGSSGPWPPCFIAPSEPMPR